MKKRLENSFVLQNAAEIITTWPRISKQYFKIFERKCIRGMKKHDNISINRDMRLKGRVL